MKHIILIGFKHVGKSTIGHKISEQLGRPFIDLDSHITAKHQEQKGEELNCEQIMTQHGKDHFRNLEKQVLVSVLQKREPCIIAMGSDTVINQEQKQLLQGHQVIHITADRSSIYERIMLHGRPDFFAKDQDSFTAFKQAWDEREHAYQDIADCQIENNQSVGVVVNQLLERLEVTV